MKRQKPYIVLFDGDNARVIKGQEAVHKYGRLPNALVCPELPKGVPPHLWFKDGKRIGVMTTAEDLPKLPHTFHFDLENFVLGVCACLLGTVIGFAAVSFYF